MTTTIPQTFLELCQRLAALDLFGDGPPAPPWNGRPTIDNVTAAIDAGFSNVPFGYQEGYATPLRRNVPTVLAQRDATLLETMTGAIYQHTANSGVDPQLDRFLAVVSNLYRSFLSETKRVNIDVPLVEQLPPLAMFQHQGVNGPFTLPVDVVGSVIGADVGVVSLPSVYRDHPVLWASLAHEAGGHDVIHADDGLLSELSDAMYALFGAAPLRQERAPNPTQVMALLWSYWIDEAAADVYGLLNIGPAFCQNLTAFFAALNARNGRLTSPLLRTGSGYDPQTGMLDPHPTDIVRIALAIGVTENLVKLSAASRAAYVAHFQELAELSAAGETTVPIRGYIPIQRDRWIPLSVDIPIGDMQEAARQAGGLIATARLTALRGHSIQEIETWDDADEATALNIAEQLKGSRSIANMGDDAQVLAGATVALVDRPDLYSAATRRINEALDVSFVRDPIWGKPARDSMFLRSWTVADLPGHEVIDLAIGRD